MKNWYLPPFETLFYSVCEGSNLSGEIVLQEFKLQESWVFAFWIKALLLNFEQKKKAHADAYITQKGTFPSPVSKNKRAPWEIGRPKQWRAVYEFIFKEIGGRGDPSISKKETGFPTNESDATCLAFFVLLNLLIDRIFMQ